MSTMQWNQPNQTAQPMPGQPWGPAQSYPMNAQPQAMAAQQPWTPQYASSPFTQQPPSVYSTNATSEASMGKVYLSGAAFAVSILVCVALFNATGTLWWGLPLFVGIWFVQSLMTRR